MTKQATQETTLTPPGDVPTSVDPDTGRASLAKELARLQSEFHRLENRYLQLESQFHSFTVDYVAGHSHRLRATLDTVKRLEQVESRLDLSLSKPPGRQKRPRREASQRRKAA